MSIRTPSLELLVLLSTAFPAQLFRARAALLPALLAPAGLLAVAGLAWYVAPVSGVTTAPSGWPWYAVAVAAGLAAPAWEVGIGVAGAAVRRRRVGRVGLHERWPGGTAAGVATAVTVAAAEEVLFRGVGLSLLADGLHAPAALAVGVTAVVYALNHLWFGWQTVGQKLLTGVLFGLLYVAAGYSLVVPLLAHVVQNVAVLVLLPRLGGRR